jgi:hypothetical protein
MQRNGIRCNAFADVPLANPERHLHEERAWPRKVCATGLSAPGA